MRPPELLPKGKVPPRTRSPAGAAAAQAASRLVALLLAGCAFIGHPDATAATETVLHAFAGRADGATPLAGVLTVNGLLYGTTEHGGTGKRRSGCGTVYSVDPRSGAETVIYAFSGADGRGPTDRLIRAGGKLYGTTVFGGSHGEGTVFSIDPDTAVETVLHSFRHNGRDGGHPYAGLRDVKGILYGTTELGGSAGEGVVYSFDLATGTESVLHSFAGDPDGQYPYTALIHAGGRLYGTTGMGGTYGWGTAFALDPTNGKITILHAFGAGTDGQHAYAALTDINGTLYGTTDYGGADGYGTVYAIDPATGAESVTHSFAGGAADGNQPVAALVDVKGLLYGTTKFGGAHGGGTVFQIDPATGALTLVYSFGASQTDGAHPYASLLESNGTLYGTTSAGGSYNSGIVFAITP